MSIINQVINSIKWKEINCFTGNCSHVPEAISQLYSSSSADRLAAYWRLDNHLVIQGYLSEGAFYIIPLLIQIVVDESEFIDEALDLLIEIWLGAAEFEKTVNFKICNHPAVYFVPAQDGIVLPLFMACRLAIIIGTKDILAAIDKLSIDYVRKVFELLSLCNDLSNFFIDYIKQIDVVKLNPEFQNAFREYRLGIPKR